MNGLVPGLLLVLGGCALQRQARFEAQPVEVGVVGPKAADGDPAVHEAPAAPTLSGPDIQQVSGEVAAALAADVQTAIDANFKLLSQDVGEQINALAVDQSQNNWDKWALRYSAFGKDGIIILIVLLSNWREMRRISMLAGLRKAIDDLLSRLPGVGT